MIWCIRQWYNGSTSRIAFWIAETFDQNHRNLPKMDIFPYFENKFIIKQLYFQCPYLKYCMGNSVQKSYSTIPSKFVQMKYKPCEDSKTSYDISTLIGPSSSFADLEQWVLNAVSMQKKWRSNKETQIENGFFGAGCH